MNLRERTDLWKPDNIEPHLAAKAEEYFKKYPRWRTIKGRKLPVFRASEAGACQRRLCYAYRGDVPSPMDVEGAMRVYDGDPHADSMVHWMEQMGYEVKDREKWFRRIVKSPAGRFAVSGHVDGVILAPEGEADKARLPYILEMKGLSTWTMKKDSLEIVNKNYRYQAQVYMWLSGIHNAIFCIKDKNNSKLQFFELVYDEKVVRAILKKWARVLAAVKEEDLLDREYAKDSLECSWCNHSETCWG